MRRKRAIARFYHRRRVTPYANEVDLPLEDDLKRTRWG